MIFAMVSMFEVIATAATNAKRRRVVRNLASYLGRPELKKSLPKDRVTRQIFHGFSLLPGMCLKVL
jgi:hypothetical protein